MKLTLKFATLSFLALTLSIGASEYSSIPVNVDELKSAIALDVKKYKIDFDKTGQISLEVNGLGIAQTFTVSAPSKSATLTLYYEKGPKSAGSSIQGHDTLHFWIGNEQGSTYSYFAFVPEKARITKTGFQDGVFQIIATSAEDRPDEKGYSLRVTNKN